MSFFRPLNTTMGQELGQIVQVNNHYIISVDTAKFVVSSTVSSTTVLESFNALALDAEFSSFQSPSDNDWTYPLAGIYGSIGWATVTVDTTNFTQSSGSIKYSWLQSASGRQGLGIDSYGWDSIDVSSYDALSLDFYIEDADFFESVAIYITFPSGEYTETINNIQNGWNTLTLSMEMYRSIYPSDDFSSISSVKIRALGVDSTTTYNLKSFNIDNLRFISYTNHAVRFIKSKDYKLYVDHIKYFSGEIKSITIEDFEVFDSGLPTDLNWTFSGSAGATISQSSSYPTKGNYSAKLLTTDGESVANSWVLNTDFSLNIQPNINGIISVNLDYTNIQNAGGTSGISLSVYAKEDTLPNGISLKSITNQFSSYPSGTISVTVKDISISQNTLAVYPSLDLTNSRIRLENSGQNININETYIDNLRYVVQTGNFSNLNIIANRSLSIDTASYAVTTVNNTLRQTHILPVDFTPYEVTQTKSSAIVESFENNPPNSLSWTETIVGNIASARSSSNPTDGTYSRRIYTTSNIGSKRWSLLCNSGIISALNKATQIHKDLRPILAIDYNWISKPAGANLFKIRFQQGSSSLNGSSVTTTGLPSPPTSGTLRTNVPPSNLNNSFQALIRLAVESSSEDSTFTGGPWDIYIDNLRFEYSSIGFVRGYSISISAANFSVSTNDVTLSKGRTLSIDTQTYETNLGVDVETLAEGFENNPPDQIAWAGFDAVDDTARTRSTNFVSQGTYSLRWSGSYGFAYGIFNVSEIPSYVTKIKLDVYIETSTDAVVALGANSTEASYSAIDVTGTSVGWYELEIPLTEEFKESTDGIVQIVALSEDWETSETGEVITQPFSVYVDNLRWVETSGTASVNMIVQQSYSLGITTNSIKIRSAVEIETLLESFDNSVEPDWQLKAYQNLDPYYGDTTNLDFDIKTQGVASLYVGDAGRYRTQDPYSFFLSSPPETPFDLSLYETIKLDVRKGAFFGDEEVLFFALSTVSPYEGDVGNLISSELSTTDFGWQTISINLTSLDVSNVYVVAGLTNGTFPWYSFFFDNLRAYSYNEENIVNFNIGRGLQIDTASYTVTNNNPDLIYGSITYITVDNQSYTVTNNNLNFNRNYVLGIQTQSFTITTNNINLNFGFNHVIDTQSYTVTTNNLNFNRNYVLGIQTQSYTVTTNDITYRKNYRNIIDTQSYTVTNTNLNLFYGYGITLETQEYDIDTNNITYKIGYRVINDTQSYDVITNDVQFINGYNLKIDTTSFTITTNNITYRKNYRNIIDTQSYAVTNNDVFYNRDYVLGIQTQSYIAFTNALTFNSQRQLTINNSNITVNSNQVGLIRRHIFNIDAQEYTVTPQDVNIRYGFTLSIQTQEYQTQTYDINYLRTYVNMISKRDFFVNEFPLNLRKTNILDIDTQSYEIDNNNNILQLSKKILINTTTYNSDFEDIGLLATRLANIENRNFSVNTVDNQLRKTSIINLETRQIDVENKDNNLLRDTLCSVQPQSFNIDTFNNNLLKSNRLPIEQQTYTVDTYNVNYRKIWMIPINSVNYSVIYNPVDLRFRPFMRVMIDTTSYDITYQDVNLKIGRLINVSTNEFNVEFEPFQYLAKFYKVMPLTAYYSGNKGIEVVYTPEYSIKPVAASNKELTITITIGMP